MSWTTPLTALPHLSDEAVAAFADGVLSGQARQRAQSHMAGCGECSDAVYGQRSASAMLRSASAPSVPSDLLDRLRELPITAELPMIRFPSGLSADGQPMFAAFAGPDSGTEVTPNALGATAFGPTALGTPTLGSTTLGATTLGATRLGPGTLGSTTVRPGTLGSTTLGPGTPAPTTIGSAGIRATPAGSGLAPIPPTLSPRPDSLASQLSADLPSHPAGTSPSRRRTSSRAGFGAAAVAAVAVGMLASTAAVAGGVTTTGRQTVPSVRPSRPFVESPTFGQTHTALLTAIPSPR